MDIIPPETGQQPLAAGPLHCYRHPQTETLLRCSRCDNPICIKCAQRTSVGHRCPDCLKTQRQRAYNMEPGDLLRAGAVSFGLSLVLWPLCSLLLGFLNFFWLLPFVAAFLAGGAAGGGLAQLIRQVVQKRRGPHLKWVTLAGILAGGLMGVTLGLLLGAPNLALVSLRIPMLLFVGVTLASAWPILR